VRFLIKVAGRVVVQVVADIDWIEAQGDHVKLWMRQEWHIVRATMQSIEALLNPTQFARIHRSRIVNVDRIRQLKPTRGGDYWVLLENGTKLRLTRRYRVQLEAVIGGWI
jgi:two-component system LytT family response regulator